MMCLYANGRFDVICHFSHFTVPIFNTLHDPKLTMAVIRRRIRTSWSTSIFHGKWTTVVRVVLAIASCALLAAYFQLFDSAPSDGTMLEGLITEAIDQPALIANNKEPTGIQMSDPSQSTRDSADDENNTLSLSGITEHKGQTLTNDRKKPETPGLAIVMFAHLKNTDRFDNLIFPALDTWWDANQTEPLYIVLTPQWKENYATMCSKNQANADYCSRLYPVWVDCPEGQFGESPCCKQEKGLLALPKDYEWTLFADDDMYFKIHVFMGLLRGHLPDAWKEPYIITAGGRSAKQLGQFGYKGVRSPYKCSELPEYRYPWGQPVVYSQAALVRIKPGLRAGGLVKQCIEFDLTHDAGNSIFHWMYQLPDYAIRISMFPSDQVPREVFGVHGIHRYIEPLDRIVTMKEVHEQTMNATKKMTYKKYMRIVNNRTGFLQTETFAKYGDPSTWGDEWHTMPVRDCMDKDMKK